MEPIFSFDLQRIFSFDLQRIFSFDLQRIFSFDLQRIFSFDLQRICLQQAPPHMQGQPNQGQMQGHQVMAHIHDEGEG